MIILNLIADIYTINIWTNETEGKSLDGSIYNLMDKISTEIVETQNEFIFRRLSDFIKTNYDVHVSKKRITGSNPIDHV